MKTAIKVFFLLSGSVAAHAALRIFVSKAMGAYEAIYCGCRRPSAWELAPLRTIDFLFFWPRTDLLSDFFWGSVAVAIYLWAAKHRKAKRTSALRAKANAVAAGPQAGVWPPPVEASWQCL